MSSLPLHRIGLTLLGIWAMTLNVFTQTPGSETLLTPSDTTYFQQFGWTVAADGETVVVGAPADYPGGLYSAGAAYVFVRDGDAWVEQAKLVAADAAECSQFGYVVAIHGDTLLVGAHYDSAYAGAAYVFTRERNAWTQQAKLTPADAAGGKEFGCAVALDGDRLVVGAMADAQGGYNAGAAYVFEKAGATWSEQAKLMSGLAQPGDLFGFAVALAGDTAVVGSPFDDDAGMDAGAVYVFARTESGWGQQAELFASDAATSDVFGWSVAIAGNKVLAGAPQKSGTAELAGAAYVFTRVGSTWSPEAKLVAADAQANGYFGYALALRRSTAAIGAPLDSSKETFAGTTYLFRCAGNVWSQDCELSAKDVRPSDQFGVSVALTDSLLAVGAPFNDQRGFDNGAAYAFALPSPNGPPVADASATLTEVVSANRVDAAVTLDGSRSSDPDNDALTYVWSAGGTEIATGSPASVTLLVGTHELALTVSDGSLTSTTAFVVTVVLPPNRPPVADASATVAEVISVNRVDAAVTLDGSRSSDPDNDPLTYTWSAGRAVIASGSPATATLPLGTHELTLTVSDGSLSATAMVTVRVTPANRPPVADASATATEVVSANRVDAVVTLDGSRSSDPDNDALTYAWSAGRAAIATGSPASLRLTLGTHALALSVSDGSLTSSAAFVVTVVAPPNTPPVADASATTREVISPNNRNAGILLDGSRSRDGEGDALTYQWTWRGRVVGTTTLAKVVLPVGRQEIILLVRDGQASDQDVVTVRVITAAAATRALMRMVEDAEVPASRERLLLTILRVAEHSFERGHMNAATHQLLVFQKVVQAREGRRIDPAIAARLVRAAQRIMDAIPRG